jgi:hypothetical protein
MRTMMISGAALLLAAGGPAMAQEAPTQDQPRDSFGVTVSGMAQAQRGADDRGIGADVSTQARARGAAEGDTASDDADAAADVNVRNTFGSQVVERAQADREGGIGEWVSANAPGAAIAAEARANAAAARTEAGVTRNLTAAARETATTARGAVDTARQTANAARDIAASARLDAQVSRENAASVREQAQALRDIARDIRPGRAN